MLFDFFVLIGVEKQRPSCFLNLHAGIEIVASTFFYLVRGHQGVARWHDSATTTFENTGIPSDEIYANPVNPVFKFRKFNPRIKYVFRNPAEQPLI